MSVRQVIYPLLALVFAGLLAACNSPPPPKHPELQHEENTFRPLSMVPERPKVNVPVGDRVRLEDQLKANNTEARRMRVQQGYAEPTLPENEPELPMPLPEEE